MSAEEIENKIEAMAVDAMKSGNIAVNRGLPDSVTLKCCIEKRCKDEVDGLFIT